MRRLSKIAVFAVLGCSFALAQTTTTITGTIRDLSQALVTSGKVTFALTPSRDTTISGYARFSPQTITCTITGAGLIKALDGVSACTLTMNTALQPTGTYYAVSVWPFNVKTSSFTFYAVLSSYDWSTVVPTPTTSPASNFVDVFSNQSVGGNKTWLGTQTFNGPIAGNVNLTGQTSISGCHNIGNMRCVDASNNAGWSGADAAAWIASAVSDCAAASCVVLLNPTVPLATALPANLPDNVAIWDLRGQGRLDIYSNPSGNAVGVPGGLAVQVGYSTAVGGCWPIVGPGSSNVVGGYFCASSSGGKDTWGINPLGNLPVGAPDANIWGSEIDLNIFGTSANRNHQYIGEDVVHGGTFNPTFGVRVWTATTGFTGAYKVGFQADGIVNTAYSVMPPDLGLTITQNVTGSGTPQTVTTSAVFGAHVHIGQTITLDSGGSQENVLITDLAGSPNWGIVGVFTKNHTSGAGFVVYTADRLWDPFESVTKLTPYHLCNLQKWAASNGTASCGFEVNDLTGAARLSDFFSTATGAHVWRDVTTAGFEWDNQATTPIATLTDTGTFNAVVVQSGGNATITSSAATHGLQVKRGTAGCATGAAVGAAPTTVVTWATAFADASYTATCGGRVVTSGIPVNGGLTAQIAASVTFQTVATTAAAAQYTNIDCIAVHD